MIRDFPFWSKTFLDEMEAAVVTNGIRLWALGGPSFLYRTAETTIWIDPYFGGTPDDSPPGLHRAVAIPVNPDEIRQADAIISTHNHVDHCHRETLLPMLSHTGAICLAPDSSAETMRSFGIPEARIRRVTVGEHFPFRGVHVHVYPAYDPAEPGAVTLVLEAEGVSLFVSGDTRDGAALTDVGAAHRLDAALLAYGQPWYMDADSLLIVAYKLRPRRLLPFHWDIWRGYSGDLSTLFAAYYRQPRPFAIQLLQVGDSLALEPA